jgi:hypothetical protein
MKLKGSIAVFAVAAAFAGNALAETLVADCQGLIGFAAYKASFAATGTGTGTGAWAEVAGPVPAFTGNRLVTCTVPKNKKETYNLGQMQNDECGLYSALASADGKVAAAKLFEAQSGLATMQSKLKTMYDYGKLNFDGYTAISGAVGQAQTSVNLLIAGQ